MEVIDTFVINRSLRSDRKISIINEFNDKPEFKLNIINAIEDVNGAFGLWKTIQSILSQYSAGKEFILICEDDHCFTENYSKIILHRLIENAIKLEADILLGGVSWFNNAIRTNDYLFWVEKFTGLQFTIIFKKFFKCILDAEFNEFEAADLKISKLSLKSFLICPFFSIQKEFGYSDVTLNNEKAGHVDQLFLKSHDSLQFINALSSHLNNLYYPVSRLDVSGFISVRIPTYIVNEKLGLISDKEIEFSEKCEFDIKPYNVSAQKDGQSSLWGGIKELVLESENNEEDILIITDHHIFSTTYKWKFLLKNILQAHAQGADCLLGGSLHWDNIVYASPSSFWIKEFSCCSFLVLFRKAFSKILREPSCMEITDIKISEILTNKLLLYPFVSYRNLTTTDLELFLASEKRLGSMRELYLKINENK